MLRGEMETVYNQVMSGISPITRLKIIELVYAVWLRDIIVEKIKTDSIYINFLKMTDELYGFKSIK